MVQGLVFAAPVPIGRGLLGQCTWAAVHRDHAVLVFVSRLGRIVCPLESLERMLVAAGIFNARGRTNAGECLVAAQPVGFVFDEISALNGKAHQALRVGLLHVEREEYDMRAADSPDGNESGNLLAHGPSLWSNFACTSECAFLLFIF